MFDLGEGDILRSIRILFLDVDDEVVYKINQIENTTDTKSKEGDKVG